MSMSLQEINQIIIQEFNGTDPVDPITKVTDHLYLGQGRVTEYHQYLSQIGITHIVSVGRPPHPSIETCSFIRHEIKHLEDLDSTRVASHFPTVFEFLRKAIKDNGKILIHCEMGCSRAPTVMVAFLRADGYAESLQQAYDLVKEKRSWIHPDQGFQTQLKEFFFEDLLIS